MKKFILLFFITQFVNGLFNIHKSREGFNPYANDGRLKFDKNNSICTEDRCRGLVKYVGKNYTRYLCSTANAVEWKILYSSVCQYFNFDDLIYQAYFFGKSYLLSIILSLN